MPRVCFRFALALATLLVSASAGAETTSNAEARRLYAQGKAEYAQGHYLEAVRLFERSYALSESPALLFNMAQAHRLAGVEHCPDAVALYKSYLLAEPNAENEKEVEERIAELGECRSAEPVPAATPASSATPPSSATTTAPPALQRRTPATPPRKASSLPTGPVLTSGAGAALLVAGGVLYWRAWDKHREAEQLCPCYPGTYSDWEVLTNVSYALLAMGGATLAGGVTWWVLGSPGGASEPAQASFGVVGAF